MSAPILALEDLRVGFPTADRRETVKAVDGVSLSINAGETFGVIGESGSGKSTLGRAAVCLLRPSSGRVLHNGVDPHALPSGELRLRRRDYQIIFQDPNAALNPRMTSLDAVREPMDIAGGVPRAERAARASRMLDLVGLGAEFAGRYPHELSGGQKQRVNIARALTLRPKLIVCDEVVSALDVSIRADILNLFAELQRNFHLTYLFITHDIGVVLHVSTRIAVMYLGRFMELAPARIIAERPLHPYTEALLSAEPVPLPSSLRRGKRIVLQGEIPSPTNPPSGCRFRTRCPAARGACAAEEPAWRAVAPDHYIACHFPGALSRTQYQ